MIQPNFKIFLWLILFYYFLDAITDLLAGAMGVEKTYRQYYGGIDIFAGIIKLIIILLVLLL